MPRSKEYTRLLMKNDHTGHSALERSLTTRMTSMKDLRLVPIPSNSQSPWCQRVVCLTTAFTLKTCRWPSWPVTSLEALPWCPDQPRAPHWPPTGWFGNITITSSCSSHRLALKPLQVSAKGMVGTWTDGINTANFSYKRIPDIVVSSHLEEYIAYCKRV